jgi:sedoheptulose-bisphosphatase
LALWTGKWHHVKETTEIGEGKLFSPGNLRATFDNPEYEKVFLPSSCSFHLNSYEFIAKKEDLMVFLVQIFQLINYYVSEKYTLRYTGGMVPDVNQVCP